MGGGLKPRRSQASGSLLMRKLKHLQCWLVLSVCLNCYNQSFADVNSENHSSKAQALIKSLKLEAHVEGGFYRRTFQADHRPLIKTENGERYHMTSIFYLLTSQSPVGHFHRNRSDIMHVFQKGDPITYYLIYPNGHLETRVLGGDVTLGHELQFVVEGGVWKASQLNEGGEFGLITEVVVPGFDFDDMTLADAATLGMQFPKHEKLIHRLAKHRPQSK